MIQDNVYLGIDGSTSPSVFNAFNFGTEPMNNRFTNYSGYSANPNTIDQYQSYSNFMKVNGGTAPADG